jgi:hypothetical protein
VQAEADAVNNKIVARFADGRILKGSTADFVPTKDHFHVSTNGAPAGSKPIRVLVKDLKALIFVKDFAGNPSHEESKEFGPEPTGGVRRIKVSFKDGEILVGTTLGYQPGRPGFFLVPVDPSSNMERCFVVAAATARIAFL